MVGLGCRVVDVRLSTQSLLLDSNTSPSTRFADHYLGLEVCTGLDEIAMGLKGQYHVRSLKGAVLADCYGTVRV